MAALKARCAPAEASSRRQARRLLALCCGERSLCALLGKDVDEPVDLGACGKAMTLALVGGHEQLFGNGGATREPAEGVEMSRALLLRTIRHDAILRASLARVSSQINMRN
jgi:hypothetical protein